MLSPWRWSVGALALLSCAAPKPELAAREFVKGFYAWYVPLARADTADWAWYGVLDRRPEVFSDTLLRMLKHDRTEQAKTSEVVGLNFDIFLNFVNGWDPCEQYIVGDSVQGGPTYRVPIHGVCQGTRYAQSDYLVAEVARRDTSWVFVDFYYPGTENHLLAILSHTRY